MGFNWCQIWDFFVWTQWPINWSMIKVNPNWEYCILYCAVMWHNPSNYGTYIEIKLLTDTSRKMLSFGNNFSRKLVFLIYFLYSRSLLARFDLMFSFFQQLTECLQYYHYYYFDSVIINRFLPYLIKSTDMKRVFSTKRSKLSNATPVQWPEANIASSRETMYHVRKM